MNNYKIIANRIETLNAKELEELVALIHTRNDHTELTGVTFAIRHSVWVPDGEYGGYYKDTDVTYTMQKKVVVNDPYNQKRRDALKKLASIGSPDIIRALLPKIENNSMEKKEGGELVVVDDLTFESFIEGRRRDVVRHMLEQLKPKDFHKIFEGLTTEEANNICYILYYDYGINPEDPFSKILKGLAKNNPDALVKLAYTIIGNNKGSNPIVVEVLKVLGEIDESGLDIVGLTILYSRLYLGEWKILVGNVIKRICNITPDEEIICNMTPEEAVKVVNELSVYVICVDITLIVLILEKIGKSYSSISPKALSLQKFLEYIQVYIEKTEKYVDCHKKLKEMGVIKLFEEMLEKGIESIFDITIEALFDIIIKLLTMQKKWEALGTVQKERGAFTTLLYILDTIKPNVSKEILGDFAKRLISKEIVSGYDITTVVEAYIKRGITVEDFDLLKELYRSIDATSLTRWGRYEDTQRTDKDAVLVEIAYELKVLKPDIVDYSWWDEHVKGERPFFSGRIRRKLNRYRKR